MSFSIVAALVVIVILSVFAFQNGTPVHMNFINWVSPEIPLWAVVTGAFLAGGLVIYLLDTVRVIKAGRSLKQESKKSKQYRKELKELQAEVDRLKGKKKSPSGSASSPAVSKENSDAGSETSSDASSRENGSTSKADPV